MKLENYEFKPEDHKKQAIQNDIKIKIEIEIKKNNVNQQNNIEIANEIVNIKRQTIQKDQLSLKLQVV